MNKIKELNENQLKDLNLFEKAIKNKESLLLKRERCFGKTTILNELGFTAQALGYNVLITSKSTQTYNATHCIYNNNHMPRGFNINTTIILIDEYPLPNWIIDFMQMGYIVIGYAEKIKLRYKGFEATFYNDEGSWFGKLDNIKGDLIILEADTLAKTKQELRETVEDYLELCKELGIDKNIEYKYNVTYSDYVEIIEEK